MLPIGRKVRSAMDDAMGKTRRTRKTGGFAVAEQSRVKGTDGRPDVHQLIVIADGLEHSGKAEAWLREMVREPVNAARIKGKTFAIIQIKRDGIVPSVETVTKVNL